MRKEYKINNELIAVRCSNWISIKNKEVTEKHRLYDFSECGDLYFFRHAGKEYALNQFIELGGPWTGGAPYSFTDDDGKTSFLIAYDSTDYCNPFYIEVNENKAELGAIRLFTIKADC